MLGGLRLSLGDDLYGRPLLREAIERYSAIAQRFAEGSPFGLRAAQHLLKPAQQASEQHLGGGSSSVLINGGATDAGIGLLRARGSHGRKVELGCGTAPDWFSCNIGPGLLHCSCCRFRLVLEKRPSGRRLVVDFGSDVQQEDEEEE